MKFPTYEEWGEKIAGQAMDVYTINGRTIREWVEILSDELTMLEKIRAEIEQLRLHKAQFITSDNKVCIDSQEVLNIIDKYRAESEE